MRCFYGEIHSHETGQWKQAAPPDQPGSHDSKQPRLHSVVLVDYDVQYVLDVLKDFFTHIFTL